MIYEKIIRLSVAINGSKMPELQRYDKKNRSLTWCLSLITESTSRMNGDARGDLWEAGLSTLMGEGTGDEELDARSS